MNKIFILLLAFISTLFGFEYKLNPQKVTQNVYCFFGASEGPNKSNGGAIANICFVDEGEYYVTIDSGPTYKFAKQAYETISSKYGKKPVKYVFVTHAHDDHLLGNDFFAMGGATVIGSPKLEEHLNASRMEKLIPKDAYEGTKVYMPDIRIKQSGQKYGNIKAIIIEPHAHTTSDIIYLDEKNQVLFVGDLVFNDRVLSLRDGSINGWLDTLEKIEKIDFKYMVSGHGKDTSTKAHLITKEYLTLLKEKVLEAIDEDMGLEKAAKTIEFKKFKNYPLYNELHSKNVFKAYQLLEFE